MTIRIKRSEPPERLYGMSENILRRVNIGKVSTRGTKMALLNFRSPGIVPKMTLVNNFPDGDAVISRRTFVNLALSAEPSPRPRDRFTAEIYQPVSLQYALTGGDAALARCLDYSRCALHPLDEEIGHLRTPEKGQECVRPS
jgi:hypothetical protein